MSLPASSVGVFSEIGRLRRVLVHRPGLEIDWMVPSMMERLLFDDILYGDDARWEHDSFTAVLQAAGVETLDPQQLLREVCQDPAVRREILEVMTRVGIEHFVLDELEQGGPQGMADLLVTGIRAPVQRPGTRLRNFYRLAPLPNYFFQRDPQIVFGDRVLIASMATEARAREPFLAATIFENHPALKSYADLVRFGRPSAEDFRRKPAIEGGDILVPSPEILMIGASERTNTYGIDLLARYLIDHQTTFKHLIVVEIPPKRSYMHLDTVFTFIDRNLCLAYLPVVAPGGAEAGDVYRVDLRAKEVSFTLCDNLPKALGDLGLEVELVPCGGSSSLIDQQREQWTDGANAFAIAPGVIMLYQRNRRTTEELDRRGWRIVTGEDVASGKVALLGQGPTAITLFDNELSRARGGPRCMTMPILRDELDG
jgi:arginine deiminase